MVGAGATKTRPAAKGIRLVSLALVLVWPLLAWSVAVAHGQPSRVAAPGNPNGCPGGLRPTQIDSDVVATLHHRWGKNVARALKKEGATRTSREPWSWRVPEPVAVSVLPRYMGTQIEQGRQVTKVLCVRPDATYSSSDHLGAGEPVAAWVAQVGALEVEPPAPGTPDQKPVTLIDTGVDLTHPDFDGRPGTTALNGQTPDDLHGTAVASLVGAQANGVGVVGIYPGAALQSWDAQPPLLSEIIEGIDTALQPSGNGGVLLLPFGSLTYDPILYDLLLAAVGGGWLVVAPAGNEGDQGNPDVFPGSLPHVLTVAAIDAADGHPPWSSTSIAIDLAAPGVGLPIAVPLALDTVDGVVDGLAVGEGSSFAAALVAGAAAWVWTARPQLNWMQIFDHMRFATRDVGAEGFDVETGFGVLDVKRALEDDEPWSDIQEPNDDIYQIEANRLFKQAAEPLTRPGPRRGDVVAYASLDATEDYEDVYRVWVPAHRTVRVVVTPLFTGWVGVELWRPGTSSVRVRGRNRDRYLVDWSHHRGKKPHRVEFRNNGAKGAYFYLDVFIPAEEAEVLRMDYEVRIRTPTR